MAKETYIKSLTKQNSGYLLIYDDQELKIDPMTVLKYKLKPGMNIDFKTFDLIKKEASYVYYDQLALKKLKKMMTTKEIRDFLYEKGCDGKIISMLIEKYIAHKYLDDLSYAKTYIINKQLSQGPLMITQKLKEKGITEQVLAHAWGHYDADEILRRLAEKKVKATKNKSLNQIKSQLYGHFVSKGFPHELVSGILNHVHLWYDVDTESLIKKHFESAYQKYIKTVSPKEAYYKSISKVHQKGFDINVIKNIISSIIEDE